LDILTRLSEDENARLIKKVAPPPGKVQYGFQIMHDAMAVPILNWTDRARRAWKDAETRRQANREARRKWRIAALAGAATIILSIVGSIFYVWASVREQEQIKMVAAQATKRDMGRLIRFAEVDPRAGYRLPILLALTVISRAHEIEYAEELADARRALLARLIQSPRYSREFTAVGFDAASNRLAVADESVGKITVCHLDGNTECSFQGDHGIESIPLPPVEERRSNDEILKTAGIASLGFIDGFDGPLYAKYGILFHRQNDEWMPIDLSKFVEADYKQFKSTFAAVEIIEGGVRVTVQDWQSSRLNVQELRVKDGVLRASHKPLNLSWGPAALVPAISPDGSFGASLSSSREPAAPRPLDDCVAGGAAFDKQGAGAELSLSGWRTGQEKATTIPICFATAIEKPALGFPYRSNFGIVLYQRTIKTFQPLGLEKNPARFIIPEDVFRIPNPPSGPPFTYAPLAGIFLGEYADGGKPNWRFAWQTGLGIQILETKSDGQLGHIQAEQTGLPLRKLLYGNPSPQTVSLAPASRLEFNKDGKYLVLQAFNFASRSTRTTLWDFSATWSKAVEEAMKTEASLKDFACRIARLDTSNEPGSAFATFTDEERVNFLVEESEPCRPADGLR